MKIVSYQLDPLTCPSCIKKIESTLNKQIGVEKVKVLYHSSKVKIEFNETMIDADNLEQILKKLGYPVLSRKVS